MCSEQSTAQPSTEARISPYRALIEEYKDNPLHAHRQYREPYNRATIEPKRAQKKKSRE